MAPVLHADRMRAESFGTQAERYDRARPTYPDALFEAVLAPAGGEPGKGAKAGDAGAPDVLDVGCGTAIAARQMAERGARVLGVEIDPRMAEVARGHGVPVEVARFEDWDPAGRTFDVVTAGQAWHWIDPAAGAAKAAGVLRPGGRLALFWNIGHLPDDLAADLEEVYAAVAPGVDRYSVILGYSRDERYPEHIAEIRAGGFAEPVREYFPWERTYSRDEWLDQLPTHSDHARLDPDVLARLVDAVGAAVDRHGGRFTMRYQTMLILAERG
jgi:SAM-dependent methyltransferase